MKKLIVTMMAAMAVFTLTACTSSDAESDSSAAKSSASQKESSATTDYPSKISSFTSTDVNGEEVSADIFKQKKFTVINFWGTYCSPCINEMADLQAWSEETSDDAQLVGVVIDVSDASDSTNETAKSIIEKTGVKFTNVIPSGGLSNFVSYLVGVPTTIIVDENGNRVGDPIVGAQIDAYKELLSEAIAGNDK